MEALLEGEAEALTRKAVQMAMAGDTVALRLCLERIAPPRRDSPVALELPEIESAKDLPAALSALLAAVAAGDVTPGEAERLSKLVAAFGQAIELHELEGRIAALEEARDERTPHAPGLQEQ